MPLPVPACRCGFLPCTADPDAAMEALWRHIDKEHAAVDALSDETLSTGHRGRFVWHNGAELLWECNDDCPHPSHEEMS